MDVQRAFYTAPELAAYLGVSYSLIKQLTARNQLPVTRVGRSVRYRAEAVEEWLKTHSVRPQGRPAQ